MVLHGYRIERHVGRGGMGDVHLALHAETGRRVALKSMNEAASASEEFRTRFRREARAAMAVQHPNVVKVYEIFENDGIPYISMEYLEGESLEQRLSREGALPLGMVARLMVRVTSAVGTAHAMGIVHRDLKPENIYLVGSPRDPEVKVLDFGIAKLTATEGLAAETAALTKTGVLMGTPYYMSPEQAFGDKTIDQRSDIWALGIILYRALSGVLPTRAGGFGEVFRLVVKGQFAPLSTLVPNLPPDVAELSAAMLEKARDKRPWDLRACHDVLRAHAAAPLAATVDDVPTFGVAVTPVWEETGMGTRERAGLLTAAVAGPHATGSLAATPGGSRPLALAAGALRLAPSPTVSGGGTLAMTPTDVALHAVGAGHAGATVDEAAATLVQMPASPAPTWMGTVSGRDGLQEPAAAFAAGSSTAAAAPQRRLLGPILGVAGAIAIALLIWMLAR